MRVVATTPKTGNIWAVVLAAIQRSSVPQMAIEDHNRASSPDQFDLIRVCFLRRFHYILWVFAATMGSGNGTSGAIFLGEVGQHPH